jgi:ABC-type antimicrobial peptide transport system permease subunit
MSLAPSYVLTTVGLLIGFYPARRASRLLPIVYLPQD